MGFISIDEFYGRRGLSGLGNPDIRFVGIPEGDAGTEETIRWMRKLAIDGAKDPAVIFKAREITANVPSKDYVAEAKAVFDWVRANIKYRMDPHTPPEHESDENYIADMVSVPSRTLSDGQGDCDDHSTLICSLAMALGKQCAFRTVNADKVRPDQASHVYPLWGLPDGRLIPMDTTSLSKPFGWEPKAPIAWNHKTYMVT